MTTIYRSRNGTSSENITRVLELMGGIHSFIGTDDIVLIKPNIQWYNQGATSISAVLALINAIFTMYPEFKGEVILGENIHRGAEPWKKGGWTGNFTCNGDYGTIRNYSELCAYLRKNYGKRFSAVHWIDVKAGGHKITSPDDESGYIWCDGDNDAPLISIDNGRFGSEKRETIMSYPVFTTRNGTRIDFKNGIINGSSTAKRTFRFINISACNHHSYTCGATMAVKNHMGICDLSGGGDPSIDGKMSRQYFNFHSFALNKYAPGPTSGALGNAIGSFMQLIRKADMNFITAEWIGLASRTEKPVARTRTILTGTDPVALDYHAAKYLLYPNTHASIHNPDNSKSPLGQYLATCSEKTGGCLDEGEVSVIGYDCSRNELEQNPKSPVKAKILWGSHPKSLMKHFLFRLI